LPIFAVAAVRRALGPQAKLMVDVNCAWSPSFAIEMGRALEPYKLYWIEEPVATDDIDGSAAVAGALATPIAGYETEIGLYGFRELIARGAVDIVQPDIAWAGGFSECRRIAALAQANHLMVAPHAFAGAVTLVASLHFIASIPNGLVLEFDQNPNGLRDELLKEPFRIETDGTIKLPERPGLGIELDRGAVGATSSDERTPAFHDRLREGAPQGRRLHPGRGGCGDIDRRSRPADLAAARLLETPARRNDRGGRDAVFPPSGTWDPAGRPCGKPSARVGPVLGDSRVKARSARGRAGAARGRRDRQSRAELPVVLRSRLADLPPPPHWRDPDTSPRPSSAPSRG
jgi:hypothetical protein